MGDRIDGFIRKCIESRTKVIVSGDTPLHKGMADYFQVHFI
jgi:hypothetical protein